MHNTKEKGRNIWLDIFKLFLAFLVVCIHFDGETYAHYPVYRLAVPMFFMISGYFNYYKDESALRQKTKTFVVRCLKYMVIGFAIYIAYDFVMCYVDGRGVGYWFTTLFYDNFLKRFFFLNEPITYYGYQLWFLIALFVVSLLHYLLVKFKKQHWYYFIIPIGVLIFLYFQGYMRFFQETDMPIRYTRNALFFGLPMFGIGFTMAKYDFHKKPWYKYLYLALGASFFFLQIAENKLMKMEMYNTSVLAAMFLLQFFLGLKRVKCDWFYHWFGKSAFFYIYIFHVAVGVVLGRIFTFPNTIFKSAAIWAASLALYEICFLLGKGIRNLQNKRSARL